MKSIQTKVIALVLCSVIFTAAVIGGASIYNSRRVVEEDSTKIMNLLCEDRTSKLNALFGAVEQSVDTLSIYAATQIDDLARFKSDGEYVRSYTESMMDSVVNAAVNTERVLTVYLRYNPAFTDPESGIFCSRTSRANEFERHPPTNLALYMEDDAAHVGWFYKPMRVGRGTWLDPYYNKNIGVEMISYVVPFYIEGEFIGVVGMDIDFAVLAEVVEKTGVYRTGYIFLTDAQAKVVCHKELPRETDLAQLYNGEFAETARLLRTQTGSGDQLISYTYGGKEKKAAFRSLYNNMRLVLTAPTGEIDAQANRLLTQIILAVVLTVAAAAAVTVLYTRRMVKPLLELTDAAKKIADGDLSVSITHHSEDEIGVLAGSFRHTVEHLNKYITYINELAYRDSLTGLKNKTAYLELTRQMDELTRLWRPRYAVAVFDINGLKSTNDTKGHDFGDMLIAAAGKIIGRVFDRSPIYRIGGDEFVVLLEGEELERCRALLERFEEELEKYNLDPPNGLRVSVARGVAIYDETSDLTYNDVFKRADSAMYRNKEEMKK